MTTAKAPETLADDSPIPDVHIGSRLYLAIRPCADSVTESARQSQERLVRAVWSRVNDLDYSRPGV